MFSLQEKGGEKLKKLRLQPQPYSSAVRSLVNEVKVRDPKASQTKESWYRISHLEQH
ncbi:hypothetical protein BofuT4_uP015540.1 [Botrytis cinerea T4]|uniref:Uncharacterized protein n=1 Tax=Botryotinia fuckeliana (strain T4) TaxID=999810 RepID=G2YHR1_BOTF4|nr:hypothetical protein BofuT4_uP015540.1 [Botrytis cinerea T4]